MNPSRNDAIALLLVALAAAGGMTLTLTRPFLAPNAEPVYTFDGPEQEALFGLVEEEFGRFTAPKLSADWLPHDPGDLDLGRGVYEVHCLNCHGGDGGAGTQRSRLLKPPPRNFSLGAIVHKSTPFGYPPHRDDLRRTVRDGLPPTSMSSFESLEEVDRNASVDYVMYLMIRGVVWNEALELLDTLGPQEAFDRTLVEQKARWSDPYATRATDGVTGPTTTTEER